MLYCQSRFEWDRSVRAVASSADGLERGRKTGNSPDFVLSPSRKEAARREQARRDKKQGATLSPDSEPVIKERQVQSMHAIIETGGKQYKVAEGDILYIEKLNAEAGESVTFEKVLAVLNGDSANFGAPVVEGATVTANVVKNGKGKKVLVFKYKPKKNYRRRQGHRQPYTKVEITKINA